jgi:signal transduction histidine kinase
LIERKRAEDALRESQEKLRRQAVELEQQLIASGRLVSLGEIAASMAHEFNNPLGIVMGFAEDLLSEKKAEDADYQPLKIIHEETKRCQKIIQDLLEYSRPRTVEKRDADVGELIEKSFKLITSHLSKHKVAGEMQVQPDLPSIEADPQQIEQVLVNLYLNAIDAMPEGGRLMISAHRNGDESLEIAVTDTGIGIAEDELGKIFQPFFSAKKKSGLGLGLPICNRIVANHGGTIAVNSRPGEGATFRIRLPVKRVVAEEFGERAVG